MQGKGFPRAHRLRKRAEFERAYTEGTKQVAPKFVLFTRPNGLKHPRVGFTATRRLGNAPVVQITITRFGARDADRTTVLGVVAEPGASVEDTIAAAAPRAASQIEEDWKLDNLLRFDLPRVLIAVMPLDDLSDWVAMKGRLSKIAFIEASELLALSRLGVTVRLRYFGNQEQLALALSQRDVRLAKDDNGWTLGHDPEAGSARAR